MNRFSNKKSFLTTVGKIADAAPYVIMIVSLGVLVGSLVAFVLADVVAGQIVGEHVSQDGWFGLLISLSMTGFGAASIALLYNCVDKDWGTVPFLLILFGYLAIQGADSYMDSLSVDIKRFGQVVSVKEALSSAEAAAHIIYRVMVGAISTIGEPIGIGSIIMFPMIKRYVLKNMNELGDGNFGKSNRKPKRPNFSGASKAMRGSRIMHNRPILAPKERGNFQHYHPETKVKPQEEVRPFFIGEEEDE